MTPVATLVRNLMPTRFSVEGIASGYALVAIPPGVRHFRGAGDAFLDVRGTHAAGACDAERRR